jgi:hypothetical protein
MIGDPSISESSEKYRYIIYMHVDKNYWVLYIIFAWPSQLLSEVSEKTNLGPVTLQLMDKPTSYIM